MLMLSLLCAAEAVSMAGIDEFMAMHSALLLLWPSS